MTPLHQASYILFSTKKRDGSFVATPVWCAGDDNTLYIFSAGQAGKVKRVRNFSECKIAPCTVTGKPLGDNINGSAHLIDDAESQLAHRQLVKKYGLQMRLLDLGAALGGRKKTRAFIRIDLT
ncbi:PPOX class F420-dependent oxidoreductase [Zhongshania sp.]|jgi:PPOX class probable F420-dependent enzyme|uniref:PPOX class F420-dependent oxidoreductase n=1 Tax=Zhongshania sp. TaxID=1971902 RepID=UPI001B69B3EF|nr:PPOX class F420-dependent oxidoreductase [Zhongshania sp.]MBQ0795864.1 PPOX class F420-dependent oxidoreductase [Zhongshania sp.]|tara:strand:- start:173 stop:541 length:369 start_codon:yes stop_codon:yes gene_type:complete